MAGSAPDPGAGGGHGWDLGRRGKGVERWGNFGVLRRGGGGLVVAGEGNRWRRGEEARRREDTLRVERASERAAVVRCKDDGSPARRGWNVG
jgi:hypothetical protein